MVGWQRLPSGGGGGGDRVRKISLQKIKDESAKNGGEILPSQKIYPGGTEGNQDHIDTA